MECRAQMRKEVSLRQEGVTRGKERSMDVVSELVHFLMECYCLLASFPLKSGKGDVVRLEVCE